MLRTIQSAIRLDVVHLLPEASDPDLLDLRWAKPPQGRGRWLYGSRIARALTFVRRALEAWFQGTEQSAKPTDAVLLAAFTTNQWRALEPIDQQLRERGVPTCMFDARHRDGCFRWLERRSYLWAMPFFPVLLYRMLTSRGFAWKSFAWGLDRYWQAYGGYVAARRWFQRQRPQALVVSNDHRFWPRVLVAAAQAEKIPTIYVQHAPVTERFPPLEMDYALLEGMHSLRTYASIGRTATRVYLVGMPRLDEFVKRPNQGTVARTVGYCVGRIDNMDRATTLIRHLARECPDLKYVVRLHPGLAPEVVASWQQLCRELKLDFSDSRTEHPFEFLSRVDVTIAGGSGIILEAALVNVTPIMVALNPERPDWYGFAADGLCPLYDNWDDVAAELRRLQQDRPAVREKARPYCATVGTAFDGRSTELAAELIQRIANGTLGRSAEWKHVERSREVEAYEPA